MLFNWRHLPKIKHLYLFIPVRHLLASDVTIPYFIIFSAFILPILPVYDIIKKIYLTYIYYKAEEFVRLERPNLRNY